MPDKPIWYVLDEDRNPVPAVDPIEAAWFMEFADRQIAREMVGDADVSTIFLCIDHNFIGRTPILFETMIFGGAYDGFTDRYPTWQLAEVGHRAVVEALRAGLDPHGG